VYLECIAASSSFSTMPSHRLATAAITSKGIRIFGFTSIRGVASTTRPSCFVMKPGAPLRGLDIYKDAESPPVALDRSQYPSWISELSKPLISLATLRRLPLEKSTEKEQTRYLKLTRKGEIKDKNASTAS
jgi:hypothetical protein